MNIAIMIGRGRSKGFPGKNLKKIYGKRLCEYPLIVAIFFHQCVLER
jgi:CMP-N-acetylneuraminic acid synthetase